MKTEERYNGWANYETWCVKLWIDNEESSYNYWLERAKEILEEKVDVITLTLADELKEGHEEAMEDACIAEVGVFTDLLNSALGEVNWYEIAESILKEASE
ncbi:MAG: hypothetical protein IMF19_07405 [Proteobacteria bacterium]|nr:hypothetical protein [Pseudomonadota bacterium]